MQISLFGQIIADYTKMVQRATDIRKETYISTNSFVDAYNAEQRFLQSDENVKLSEYYKTVKRHPSVLKQKWGDISDFYSGYTLDTERLVTMGHSKSYWKKDINNRAIEAFAECASAKATNAESYAVIKKYFPRTMQGFEYIYDQLKQGKIQSKGRPKYAK